MSTGAPTALLSLRSLSPVAFSAASSATLFRSFGERYAGSWMPKLPFLVFLKAHTGFLFPKQERATGDSDGAEIRSRPCHCNLK